MSTLSSLSWLLAAAMEQVADLLQVGLHVRRVEVSAHLLIVVLWKAQIKHQLNEHRRNVGSRGKEGSESWLCADVLALSSFLSSTRLCCFCETPPHCHGFA